MANREAIIKKVRALLSMTMENGASEAEAVMAARRAGELMREYNLDMTTIELGELAMGTVVIKHRGADKPNGGNRAKADFCLVNIGIYCGVKVWFSTKKKPKTHTKPA